VSGKWSQKILTGDPNMAIVGCLLTAFFFRGKTLLLFQIQQFLNDPTARSIVLQIFSNEQEEFMYKVIL
jgi:hypothetical protein